MAIKRSNKAAYEAAQRVVEQDAEAQHEAMLQQRRDMGFVETVSYTNAFGDVTTRSVNVLGRTKGTMLTIRREGTGKLVDVCFSAITDDSKRELFAPYFSTPVYAKFDGGETKSLAQAEEVPKISCVLLPATLPFQYGSC